MQPSRCVSHPWYQWMDFQLGLSPKPAAGQYPTRSLFVSFGNDMGSERTQQVDVVKLNRLLGEWREPGLTPVSCQDIIPDTTNREYMGLSLEHTHFIAAKIFQEGFQPRRGTEGHDIPVLVRETATSPLGVLSLSKWRQRVQENPGCECANAYVERPPYQYEMEKSCTH